MPALNAVLPAWPVPANNTNAATSQAGVKARFIEDFNNKILPQFGITRDALRTPTTREEWIARFQRTLKDDDSVHVEVHNGGVVMDANNEVQLISLGDGLQALKSDVEKVRRLVRLPRCRNKEWELVEAEVDLSGLPTVINADTPLRVRVKDDPNSEWMDFLKARDVALIQTSDIVDFVVKPVTQWKEGRKLSEDMRKTYADHVADVHPFGIDWVSRAYYSGPATHFVSHAWMDSYLDFTDALTAGSSTMDSRTPYYRTRLKEIITSSAISGSTPFEFKPLDLTGMSAGNAATSMYRQEVNNAALRKSSNRFFLIFLPFAPLVQFGYIALQFLPSAALHYIVNVLRDFGACCDSNKMLWIDIFCKNQWIVNSSGTQEELKNNVGGARRGLRIVCHSWSDPHAFQRVWCQFELSVARQFKAEIVGVTCENEGANMRKTLIWENWRLWSPFLVSCVKMFIPFVSMCTLTFDNLPEKLEHLMHTIGRIDFENAQATVKKDKDMIRKIIQESPTPLSPLAVGGTSRVEQHNQIQLRSFA